MVNTAWKKVRRVAPIAVVSAVLLAGCAPTPDGTPTDPLPGAGEVDKYGASATLISAAQEEGSLLIYSADVPIHNELPIEEFKKVYPGIDVQFVRLNSDEVAQRYGSEREAGVVDADIVIQSDRTFFERQTDWFVNLDELDLKSLDAFPESERGDTWATASTWPLTIQYNTELVPEKDVPTTWQDLLDPKWKGKLLLNDPQASASPMSWAGLMQREYGDEYLEELAKQDFDMIESSTPGAQQVASGAYAMNFAAGGGASASPLMEQGAPINFVVVEPTITPANLLAISKGSEHPNAAALYANFRLSEDGFKIICGTNPFYSAPIPGDFPGCVQLPKNAEKADFELWNDQDARANIMRLLGQD